MIALELQPLTLNPEPKFYKTPLAQFELWHLGRYGYWGSRV